MMNYRGTVMRGEGRGRKLGFPTANIVCTDTSLSGTYAGLVTLRGKLYQAAVYADGQRGLLEAHLLDVSDDMYGEEIVIALQARIAPSKAIANHTDLQHYIGECIVKVRNFFKS